MNAEFMNYYAWDWLVRSVDLGSFPIPIKVDLDHRQDLKAIEIVIRYRSRDVEEPHNPITIKSSKAIPYSEAFTMAPAVAEALLRKEITSAVLHELDECLWIGGRREDPHR